MIGTGYVHFKVYKTLIDSYAECEKTCDGKTSIALQTSEYLLLQDRLVKMIKRTGEFLF
jgi:hypothetical protein